MQISNDLRIPRIVYTRKALTSGIGDTGKITHSNLCSENKSGHNPTSITKVKWLSTLLFIYSRQSHIIVVIKELNESQNISMGLANHKSLFTI